MRLEHGLWGVSDVDSKRKALTSFSSPVRYPTLSEYSCMASRSLSMTDFNRRYHLSMNSAEYSLVAPKSMSCS